MGPRLTLLHSAVRVMLPPLPITAMALCNGMGDSAAAVLAALRAGRSGLGPCPAEIGVDAATVGAVPSPLPWSYAWAGS